MSRSAIERFARGRGHWIVGALATATQSVRRRYPNLVFRDREKHWINIQRGTRFVTPDYSSIAIADTEKDVRDLWLHYESIRPGDTVIDIGAGVGDHAIFISRLIGPTGRLIAIEAHPRTFACLQKSIRLNGLKNVMALQTAVTDKPGTLFMSDDTHHVNRVGLPSGIPVTANSLDAILHDLAIVEPTLIKMNIEGAETAALRGATQVLSTRARWIVSCHDFAASSDPTMRTCADVTSIFRSAGLRVRTREDERPWINYYVYADRAQDAS